MNNYVLDHDFGYGKEPEQEVLNKLELRNINDLTTYIHSLIKCLFVANFENDIITFTDDNSKTKISIKQM